MDSIKNLDIIVESKEESLLPHTENTDCDCTEFQNDKKCYVQILDMERYVEHLNDWD